MLHNTSDTAAIDHALALLGQQDIRFMRIHLQDTGNGGWQCHATAEDVPWRHDIWGAGSPYVAAACKADQLLGRFIDELRRMGKWADTLLVVTADHGNAPTGAHPPVSEDGWITPLLFVGLRVARGRRFDYAEHLDITPTICSLMDVEPPNRDGGSGRVLQEILEGQDANSGQPANRVQELNELNRQYTMVRAQLLVLSQNNPALAQEVDLADREFYSLGRFTEWHEAGSIDRLLETNRRVLKRLEASLPKQQ